MMQEVELKLVLTADAADQVARELPSDDATRTTMLEAIYFDTPEQTLRGHGASLRIRRAGDTRIQTIKIDPAKGAGLFSRPEWERPVTDDRPRLDDTTPVFALLDGTTERLAPAFTVSVERRSWEISENGAEIELVLDRGMVRVGERQSPVCEVEIELKRGDPIALFTLARRIADMVPLRLGVVTKSERGYGLTGPVRRAFKAEPVSLDGGATTIEALRTVIGACLRHYRLNETILLETRAPEALHQARVALRRTRAALGLFKRVLGREQTAHFRSELRWLAQTLGQARDLDVLADMAAAKLGAGDVFDRIEAARGLAYDEVDVALKSSRVRAVMLDLTQWLAVGDWSTADAPRAVREAPASAFAAAALRKRRKALRIDAPSLALLTDDERHAIRKDAKTLRYATEFFADLFADAVQQKRQTKFVSTLETLQDRLGTLNDAATVPTILARLGIEDSEAALVDDRKHAKRLDRAAAAHSALLDRKAFWR